MPRTARVDQLDIDIVRAPAAGAWSPALAHRAALLRCWRDDVETCDLVDLAAILAHDGLAGPASLIRAMTAIEFGHPPSLGRDRGARAQPSAIDDVRGLARCAAAASDGSAPGAPGDPAALIHALADALADRDGAGRIDAILARLDRAIPALPLDLDETSGEALAVTIAVRRVRDFLWRHRDLAFAPHGSGALFHAAARLQRGTLGPYCENMDRLLMADADLLVLIRSATETAPGAEIDPDALTRWLAILTTRLPRSRVRGIATLLGDLGLGDAALGLLECAIHRAPVALPDRELFIVVRDALIDLGDIGAATEVQRRLATTFAHEDVELQVLADLEATRGAFATAIELLEPIGGGAVPHPQAARLAALRAGRYDAYRVTTGYASSPESRRLRRNHRASPRPTAAPAPAATA